MPEAKDHVSPRIPWYNPRSARGTKSDTRVSERLRIPPPPIPWTARFEWSTNIENLGDVITHFVQQSSSSCSAQSLREHCQGRRWR